MFGFTAVIDVCRSGFVSCLARLRVSPRVLLDSSRGSLCLSFGFLVSSLIGLCCFYSFHSQKRLVVISSLTPAFNITQAVQLRTEV